MLGGGCMRKALTHLKKSDPRMRDLIRRVGAYTIEYAPADFATLVRCIIYQQLSGKVAVTIFRRLEELLDASGMTPEAVLALPPEPMRELGLSRQKIRYVRELATACVAGTFRPEELAGLPDEKVMQKMTRLTGVGPWTVHMYLIFALRRPDVLPSGDLGIRAAVRNVYGLDKLPAPAEVERIGKPWRPYASVASWYLWRSLGDGAGL